MQKIARKDVNLVLEVLLQTGVYKVEKYINDKLVIRATRRTYNRKIRATDNVEVLLVIGKPNFEQREVIRLAKKNKLSFPLKGVIIKEFPKKKK